MVNGTEELYVWGDDFETISGIFEDKEQFIATVNNVTLKRVDFESLFLGSYLQVTWWALGQWKGRKNSSNDN